jgi:hypothetical protein
MPVALPFLNPNQQEQSNIVGQLDLQGGRPASVISGLISPNASAAVVAGSSMKLDTANTGHLPWFLPCAVGDVAIGKLVYTEKNASPGIGDAVEVALLGAFMWIIADATITLGSLIEDGTDGPEYGVTLSANKQRGIALDSATAGQLFRLYIYPSLT